MKANDLCIFASMAFQDPIKNYRVPMKHLVEWFDTLVVTKKREDIVNLIKRLMDENKKKISLPEIQLPTENGKLLELPDFSEEHGEFEEEDEADAENSEVISKSRNFLRQQDSNFPFQFESITGT